MINSVAIQNFRCFEKLSLSSLRPINIIVGRNSSGKTALLEALFLTLGNSPQTVFRLRRWRGMGEGVQISAERSSYEALWQDLFFSLQKNRTISISITGSPILTRALKIYYKPEEFLTLPLGEQQTDPTRIAPITFEWESSTGEPSSVQPVITAQGLQIGFAGQGSPGTFFSSFLVPDPQENAARFSELSKINQVKDFTEVMHREFPWIEGLGLEMGAGITQIYASLSSMETKLPVTIVSGGVNKLMSILLAMANYSNGVTLIDEVENGFYYDRLLSIWSLLLKFSQKYDNQVFAATHSLECLKATLPILRNNEDHFCLIRMEREETQSIARVFTGKDVRRAIEQDMEIR